MKQIELKSVEKFFGKERILKNISLEINEGEFFVFVGPSGCGKSTLLRVIAGLEQATTGDVFISGKSMNDIDSSEREVAMVFQSYALYPHMSVRNNIEFPLKMHKVKKSIREEKVLEAARFLRLENYLNKKPKMLSGGQRQRVAIGRAIVRDPKVFLFDEPLSNLDAELRHQMRFEISSLHQKLKSTIVYVTHDQVEAMTLADKIVVLNKGVIEGVGTPLELYNNPQNIFVAGFIGSPKMNFLTLTVESDKKNKWVNINSKKIFIDSSYSQKNITMGIRPEHLMANGKEALSLNLKVLSVEQLGNSTHINAELSKANKIQFDLSEKFLIDQKGTHHYSVNKSIKAAFSDQHLYFFSTENGERVKLVKKK